MCLQAYNGFNEQKNKLKNISIEYMKNPLQR